MEASVVSISFIIFVRQKINVNRLSTNTVLRQVSITFTYAVLAVIHIVHNCIADLFVNLDMSLGDVSL